MLFSFQLWKQLEIMNHSPSCSISFTVSPTSYPQQMVNWVVAWPVENVDDKFTTSLKERCDQYGGWTRWYNIRRTWVRHYWIHILTQVNMVYVLFRDHICCCRGTASILFSFSLPITRKSGKKANLAKIFRVIELKYFIEAKFSHPLQRVTDTSWCPALRECTETFLFYRRPEAIDNTAVFHWIDLQYG